MTNTRKAFTRFATTTAKWAGRPMSFAVCCFVVMAWALSGPLFGFSDTWQLVINTSTTIVTFLMVFLIQNTQNRDSEALHAKLDELIRVSRGHNSFIGIENLSDEELEDILAQFDKVSSRLQAEARDELKTDEQVRRRPARSAKLQPAAKPRRARTAKAKAS